MPCQRHTGPHVDASLLCWQRAVVLLPRSCRCFSDLVVWCLSTSFVVFQAFSLNRLNSSLLSSICRKCPSHLNLLSSTIRSIFSSYHTRWQLILDTIDSVWMADLEYIECTDKCCCDLTADPLVPQTVSDHLLTWRRHVEVSWRHNMLTSCTQTY